MHSIFRPSSVHRGRLGAESIRELVFGVEDGVVQNMTLIVGMIGAALSNRIIVIAAAINAIAGVLSMSMGTYLSSKAERDVAIAARNGFDRPSTDPEPPAPIRSPRRDAFVMAGAYALGASIPLLPFVGGSLNRAVALPVAVILAGLTLFFLGAGKAALSNQSRIRSGFEMLLLASAAGLAGYLLGVVARVVFGLEV
jgi:VIT1/CCC1 family predicted Fe2+/Mn2+ transporter